MPTYEYKCDACGHAFEKFQQITAAPVKKCPECGKSKVRRLISAGGGMIFKGSGFYITDYRSEGYSNAAKADSAAKEGGGESGAKDVAVKDSGSTAEGKAETKTEAKAEAKPEAKVESKPVENKTASKSAAKSESKPSKSAKK